VLVLIAIMASYIGPLINLVDSWQSRNSATSDLASLRRQNASLKQAVSSEKESVSAAARKLGMVGSSERSYFVHGLN
jgi:cell division protein FtsB